MRNRIAATKPVIILGVAALVVFLLGVFHHAQQIGGLTWDEPAQRAGTLDQLHVAKRWLAGDTTASFTQLRDHYAFYGIVPIVPAFVAEKVAGYLHYPDPAAVFSYTLHAIAFASYLASLALVYCILVRTTGNRLTGGIGTAMLAAYPLWLGYSFFDYKDMPTPACLLLAIYAAVGILQAGERRREWRRFAALLGCATALIAGMKVGAVLLLMPSWAAALWVLARRRDAPALTTLIVLTAIGVFAVTPVAWSDPFRFAWADIELMSRFEWRSCTLTFGRCLAPASANWSAAEYLAAWFSAQIPVLIGLAAIAGTVIALRGGPVTILIAASALVPLALLMLRNSTLYNGLRHVLFEIPLLFILALLVWNELRLTVGKAILVLITAAQLGIFIWDDVALFPYNYVYFNLPVRQVSDDRLFVTDYWGFSLREALSLPFASRSSDLIIGYPGHLVAPLVSGGRAFLTFGQAVRLPQSTSVVLVSVLRLLVTPFECRDIEYVTRQLPLGGRPLHLSLSAQCKIYRRYSGRP